MLCSRAALSGLIAPGLLLASTGHAYTATGTETHFDARESFANGAVVFTQPVGARRAPGSQLAGVLRIDDISPLTRRDGRHYVRSGVTAHELIHAVQYDFVSIVWGEPLESWMLQRVRGGQVIHRYVDLGILVPTWSTLNSVLDSWSRPWEKEAHSLAPGV